MAWTRPLRAVRAVNFDVRKESLEIRLLCRSYGQGTVTFELISPKKVYTEKDMKISEKISLSLHGIVFFRREKTGILSVKNTSKPERWTAYCYPCGAIIRDVEIMVD